MAPLRAQYADYRNPATAPVAAAVEYITTLRTGTTLECKLFPGTAATDVPQGVLGWLSAETDPYVVEDTVDLDFSRSSEEDREERE